MTDYYTGSTWIGGSQVATLTQEADVTPTPPNTCPAAGTAYTGATAYVGLKRNACTGTGCAVVLSDVHNCSGPVCDATFTSTGQTCTDQPPPPASNNDCPTGTLYAEFNGEGRCVAVSDPVTPAPTTPTPGPSPTPGPTPPTTPVPGDGGGTGGGGGSGGGGGTTPGDGEGEGGEGSEYCKDNPGSLICIKVTKPGQSGSYDLDAVKQELADAQSEWNDLMATIQEELADLVDFDIGGGSSMAWSTRIFGSREVAVQMSDFDEIWTYIPMLLMFLAALACAFILFDL
ncbi:hypothetical protein [Chitinolyticbacter meiyuanensis]|uniref:hypothetical protein n=1 Tax=Chitinolyticbacter meiyuanensis TaxID=682798 RepID=UPI0011E5C7EF|nr:hypothetical protein [Chitinolyticbacter meiyuanensis]